MLPGTTATQSVAYSVYPSITYKTADFVPCRGSSQAMVDLLSVRVKKAGLAEQGAQSRYSTPQAFGEMIEADAVRWADVVKRAGVSLK